MSHWILIKNGCSLELRPNLQGVCLIMTDTYEGEPSIHHHFDLDLRDLTLLQAELDDLIFDLQEQEYDDEPDTLNGHRLL
jgi:hypothetical protein